MSELDDSLSRHHRSMAEGELAKLERELLDLKAWLATLQGRRDKAQTPAPAKA